MASTGTCTGTAHDRTKRGARLGAAILAAILAAGGCASAGVHFRGGVDERLLDGPPYYPGAEREIAASVCASRIRHRPSAHRRMACEIPRLQTALRLFRLELDAEMLHQAVLDFIAQALVSYGADPFEEAQLRDRPHLLGHDDTLVPGSDEIR